MLKKIKIRITYTQIIALGFAGIILLGACLLSLPLASRSGSWTPFLDSLFTSTSATAVTGLVIYDTFAHWSCSDRLLY
jgi:trk system potassium uptake protein TrkH